ncbi:MAG: CHAD domain-containing protein [Pirellulales bacterium]|nr:CHAD domain-containing protein [Pirellulales bacterium]
MASKWILLELPEVPAAQFASSVLRLRLQSVEETLPPAVHAYRQDIEHVHALRVSCRRASAALKAFQPLMQGKPTPLAKWLKRLRQAAGPARDADVMLERLKDDAKQTPGSLQIDYLLARLKRSRRTAQQALLDVETKAHGGKLQRSLEKCLALLEEDKVPQDYKTVNLYARRALRRASRGMFDLAVLSQPTIAQLHALRIAGKRLRYSIELFSAAFPPKLRRNVYPVVKKLQTRLGCLNDHATAQAMFQRWLTNLPTDERAAYLARRIAEEHDAAQTVRQDFLKWWTPKRVATLESQLAELIEANLPGT